MADQAKAPKGQEWYYRPGTTEPELREIPPAAEQVADSESADVELKGKLPEDFPSHDKLVAAGLTTYAKVRKELEADKPFADVEGIGPASVEKIREAMTHPAEEESPE